MSTERLREAARVLRERAEAATRGPWSWEQYRDDLPSLLGIAGTPGVYEWRQEVIEADHIGECGCRSSCYLTLGVDRADQTYIATMHPGVGLALADWLDKAAQEWDVWGEHDRNIDKPLALADLILGDAS